MATKTEEKKAAKDNIQASEGVTPEAELEAALDEPAGSTQFSGASAGIKAVADTDPPVFESKAAADARERAEKEADAVREIQEDTQRRNLLSNVPVHPVATAYERVPEKGDPGSLTFSVLPGELVVTSTGRELRFGREEAAGLQRAVAQVAGQL